MCGLRLSSGSHSARRAAPPGLIARPRRRLRPQKGFRVDEHAPGVAGLEMQVRPRRPRIVGAQLRDDLPGRHLIAFLHARDDMSVGGRGAVGVPYRHVAAAADADGACGHGLDVRAGRRGEIYAVVHPDPAAERVIPHPEVRREAAGAAERMNAASNLLRTGDGCASGYTSPAADAGPPADPVVRSPVPVPPAVPRRVVQREVDLFAPGALVAGMLAGRPCEVVAHARVRQARDVGAVVQLVGPEARALIAAAVALAVEAIPAQPLGVRHRHGRVGIDAERCGSLADVGDNLGRGVAGVEQAGPSGDAGCSALTGRCASAQPQRPPDPARDSPHHRRAAPAAGLRAVEPIAEARVEAAGRPLALGLGALRRRENALRVRRSRGGADTQSAKDAAKQTAAGSCSPGEARNSPAQQQGPQGAEGPQHRKELAPRVENDQGFGCAGKCLGRRTRDAHSIGEFIEIRNNIGLCPLPDQSQYCLKIFQQLN